MTHYERIKEQLEEINQRLLNIEFPKPELSDADREELRQMKLQLQELAEIVQSHPNLDAEED